MSNMKNRFYDLTIKMKGDKLPTYFIGLPKLTMECYLNLILSNTKNNNSNIESFSVRSYVR